MKTDTPQTVYLKDYTPPAFWIDTVDLDFDIDASGTTVSATLAMRRNAARPGQPLVLDGEELQTDAQAHELVGVGAGEVAAPEKAVKPDAQHDEDRARGDADKNVPAHGGGF